MSSFIVVLLCCRCEIHYSVFATHARRSLLVTFEHSKIFRFEDKHLFAPKTYRISGFHASPTSEMGARPSKKSQKSRGQGEASSSR